MNENEEPEIEDTVEPIPITPQAHATAKIGGTIVVSGRSHWPSYEFGDAAIEDENDLQLTERVQTIALDGYLNLAHKARIAIAEFEKDK